MDGSNPEDLKSPPKKKSKKKPKPKWWVHMTSGVLLIQDTMAFINQIMRNEGFTDEGSDAMIGYRAIGLTAWHLETSSKKLAEEACYLNGIHFRNVPLHIARTKDCKAVPRFSNWNEYHLFRYGKNDHNTEISIHVHVGKPKNKHELPERKLIGELRKKLKDHDLGGEDAIKSSIKLPSGTFVLVMKSPREADTICYLNGLVVEKDHTVHVHRRREWEGPPPKFRNYKEFLWNQNENKRDSKEERSAPLDNPSFHPSLRELVVQWKNDHPGIRLSVSKLFRFSGEQTINSFCREQELPKDSCMDWFALGFCGTRGCDRFHGKSRLGECTATDLARILHRGIACMEGTCMKQTL